jgi:murein DD-endopeptidase MepM/ murein hydrolase activator NlpD
MDTKLRTLSFFSRNGGASFAAGLFLVCCLGAFTTARSAASGPLPAATGRSPFDVTLSSAVVETGGTLVVELDCRRAKACPQDLRLSYQDQVVTLFQHPAKEAAVLAGLVAISLTAPPGKTHLVLAWGTEGRRHTQKASFSIRAGIYGKERLKVDPRHVKPSQQDLERIRREQEELNRIYASGSPARLWQESFQLPVPGEVNGPFGTRRIFNGELQSYHTGVDFRAQTGDPIHAAASGVVRLSRDLFYSGNAVIIDHGAGVFTSYSHLSRINVQDGQKIEKGQAVGLAGATGRATGPHLHWTVKVNSINVNPLAFVRAMDSLRAS